MADAWQIAAIGKLNGEDYVNSIAVSANANAVTDPLTVVTAASVVNVMAVLYEEATGGAAPNRGLYDHLSDGFHIERYRVTDLRPGLVPPVEVSRPMTGASGVDDAPNQIAAVASIISNDGGRSGRGRIFLGGFIETDLDDAGGGASLLSDTLVTGIANAMDDLGARFAALVPPRSLGVFSRQNDVFYVGAVVRVANVPKTQRRRQNALTPTKIVNVTI